jgi:hypothetical protein
MTLTCLPMKYSDPSSAPSARALDRHDGQNHLALKAAISARAFPLVRRDLPASIFLNTMK